MRTENRCGYTLVEIMMVVIITMVIAGFGFPQFVETTRRMALDRGAQKLASDLRRARIDGSSPDTVRFASFGPTLTGPVTYTLSSGGYSTTVFVEASGMTSVD